MSRRDPCVLIRVGIERAPSVSIVADSDGDFRRLAFAVRASDSSTHSWVLRSRLSTGAWQRGECTATSSPRCSENA
jgi:hypothetical protein